jgi:lipid-binding SYLF domain-containing protein
MPLTNELMKAFDIYSDREGWLIAMKVHDDDTWSEMKKGRFTGFSIGGKAGSREAIE